MKIPVSYKLTSVLDTGVVSRWLAEHELFEKVSYDWVRNIITFEDEQDALAFSLAFGIKKHKTIIDEKLENEESYD